MNREEKGEMVYKFNIKARQNDYYMSVHSHRPDYRNPRNVVYVINWSAIGSVDVPTTKKFIKHLQEAISLCNKLNR